MLWRVGARAGDGRLGPKTALAEIVAYALFLVTWLVLSFNV